MSKSILLELVETGVEVNEPYKDVTNVLNKAAQLEELGFKDAAIELKAKALKTLRLAKLTEFKYIKITTEMIQKFLDRKAEQYNKEHPIEKSAESPRYIFSTGINGLGSALGGITFFNSSETAMQQIAAQQQYAAPANTFIAFDNPNIGNGLSIGVSGVRYIPSMMARTNDFTTGKGIGQYKWLEQDIKQLKKLPPDNVLNKLATEKERNLFDYFTVARLEELPDPLLLGRIDGSEDRFFIAQWDNDITLDELI